MADKQRQTSRRREEFVKALVKQSIKNVKKQDREEGEGRGVSRLLMEVGSGLNENSSLA